ncbi:MAG: response regulator [Lachnospiraceae bacterium]|nr:response regulator [Lachnospiraceae bacterium]
MRLLIVDDEHYIVNYLTDLIEEQHFPDLEIYKCYSGKEALSLIQTSLIDLMLLDIHMPGMSGLEVASQVSEQLPRCRIIFLTAYDSFDHIYESNKLEHTRYLLKTEDDEVILKEISHTLEELEEESNKLLLLSEAQQKAFLLSHLLQQNILKGIVAGHSIEKLERELKIAGSDFTLDLHRPVYLMYTQVHYKTLDETNLTNSTYTLQYLQLIRKLLEGKFQFSMLDFGKGTLLLFFQPLQPFSSEYAFLQSVANDFGDYYFTKYRRRVTTVLYPEVSEWNEVCSRFHKMQQYAELSGDAVPLIYPSDSTHEDNTVDTLPAEVSIDRVSLEKKLQELSFYLYQGAEKDYLHTLKSLCAECTRIRSMHSISAIKTYTSVSLLLMQYIDLYQLQGKIASKIALYPLYYIHDFSSWKEAFRYLEKLSGQIFDILHSKKLDRNEQLVQKIKTYIRDHISESLTLTTISRIVNYNEAYISRLFKQINGMGISEYISLERINKAKDLLVTTSDSMQNIAAATGFDTAQYFSLVFKKTTGVSPSEYRRSHM